MGEPESVADIYARSISDAEYRELEGIKDSSARWPAAEEEEVAPPELIHIKHPIEPNRSWCGAESYTASYHGIRTSKATEVTCVGCLHLYIEKGADWWWDIHRRWYGTDCQAGEHEHGRCP